MHSDEEHEELVAEVHDLRSLTQARCVDLERFEDIRYTARHLARLVLRSLWRRARLTVRRLARPYLVRRASRDYHHTFSPYQVRHIAAQHNGHDRLRVLHAIANFAVGGSAQLVVDLIEGLGAEADQRVIVRALPRMVAYTGVTIDEYRYLTSSRPLRALIKQFRPDIVHVHYVADQRRCWSEMDYRWYMHVFDAADQTGIKLVQNVNIPTEPFRTTAVDRYVFVSDYVRQRYARAGDPATVIYPGSDLDRFRRPLGHGPSSDTVGLVYRLEPDKLNEAALDPMIHVLRARPAVRALIVGGGGHLRSYRRAVDTAGVSDRTTFTGYVAYDDLPAWYANMSVFVAPVYNESFGQVSVFAMGMELPVAGYRAGALEEILGSSDLLAPMGQSEMLGEILVSLLDDPSRSGEIGTYNRRRAEERFSLSTMLERYRKLYTDVLAERQAR